MRYILSGQLHWVALGVGTLLLGGGISVSVWLLQRNDGPGPVLGASSMAPASAKTGAGGGEVPGLPFRNTTGLQTKNTTAEGSSTEAEALQSKDAGGTGPGLTPADGVSVSDSVEMEIQLGGPAPDGGPGDGASVSDSAELEVQRGGPAPDGGGSGDGATFQDSADLVVRDASGNIKRQETVR